VLRPRPSAVLLLVVRGGDAHAGVRTLLGVGLGAGLDRPHQGCAVPGPETSGARTSAGVVLSRGCAARERWGARGFPSILAPGEHRWALPGPARPMIELGAVR